ncbi:MAG: Ig-like domain-containing protein [Verrucomicrobiales bacterium]
MSSSAWSQTVTTSPTAPVTEVLSSLDDGSAGIDTSLYDEEANDNHARGQLFSLPDGGGSGYRITAITVKKSNAQSYNNDTLTLRIFRGTEDEWTAGTGHDSSIDGSNYYVDTTVTPLLTETFTLDGSYANNNFVTFTLGTPIVVQEASDFGFFMTYEQGDGSENRFRHRENSSGGRLSISGSGHSVSTRNIVYYVHGTAVTGVGTVSVSGEAPDENLIDFSAAGTTDTALFDEDSNANHSRGQLFTTPDAGGATFEISAITLRKSTSQAYSGDSLTLRIFEGTEEQWESGTGHETATDGDDYYVGTTVTPVHTETFSLDGSYADGDYLTFELSSPAVVNENANVGFFLTYDQLGGAEGDFRHYENGSGGGRLSISTSSHGVSDTRKLVYYVQGSRTTPPSALAFATPFQDGMVLQRNKPITIWGVTHPETDVAVEINGSVANGTSDAEGNWKLILPALSADGLEHTLTATSGDDRVMLEGVLIGDVWLTFGQSNMVRPLSEMTGRDFYIDEIESNGAPVRCLKVTQFGALTPQETSSVPGGHYVSGGMNWLDPSTAETWSSVATVFAYHMQEATGVPTAIIWAAWGSSSIEGWLPAELADDLPHFADLLPDFYQVNDVGTVESYATSNGYSTNREALAALFEDGWTGATSSMDIFVRTRSNVIYNQMIHPLLDFGLSGFVWYQGEANTGNITEIARYGFSLPAMVSEYRARFGQGDLPFYGVQLPSYNGTNWEWFREAQSQVEQLPNAHVAVTLDTGLVSNIHPYDKEPIGIRLSLLARKYTYGESIEAHGPRFSSMSIDGDEATISFSNATGLTTDDGLDPATFELAGEDEVFYAATSASLRGEQVTVRSSSVSNPVAVRYAWSPAPVGDVNLVNNDGLPAAPFRTDSWALPGLGSQAPQGIDDSYEAISGIALNVPANGILANDIDLNRDVLSATLVDDVANGTLALGEDGSFVYTANQGFVGVDQFTYTSSDGSLQSSPATVTITVEAIQSGYGNWSSSIAWSDGDDSSEDGDPDLDGVVNFLEYAFGMDPLVASRSGMPTLTAVSGGVNFDFANVQEGLLYQVQLSSDLVTWSDPPFAELTSESTTPVFIPESESIEGSLFVRLQVVE